MPQPTALILDDDGTFARAAGQLAFSAGFRVQLAETLAEARTFLARTRADLVLLDLNMPGAYGFSGLVHGTTSDSAGLFHGCDRLG